MNKKKRIVVDVILLVGYLMAVPPLFQIVKLLKKPNTNLLDDKIPGRVALTSELIGMVLITTCLFALRRNIGAAINGIWLIAFSGLWLRAERKTKSIAK